jgi:hypothetical protein
VLFGLNVVIDELALHLFSVVIYLGIGGMIFSGRVGFLRLSQKLGSP